VKNNLTLVIIAGILGVIMFGVAVSQKASTTKPDHLVALLKTYQGFEVRNNGGQHEGILDEVHSDYIVIRNDVKRYDNDPIEHIVPISSMIKIYRMSEKVIEIYP